METKTVYQTDDLGFFLYAIEANELYLSPGSFNMPYGAVEDPPPVPMDGMVAIWRGEQWEVVEDHRSEQLYLTASGKEYLMGSSVEVGGQTVSYRGGGPIPVWLTVDRPDTTEAEVAG